MRALPLMLAALSMPLQANTIAYWRFEGDGTAIPTDGAFVQDTNGRTAVQAAGVGVPDVSGNGNRLYTWDNDFTGHIYKPATAAGPFTVIPQTGAANGWYVVNSGGYPASFTWSPQSVPGGINLDTWTSATWTIEASIYTTTTDTYRTFIGREGNGVNPANLSNAPLYFQMTPGGAVRIAYVDAAGNFNTTQDLSPIGINQWYHFAATCDGTTLKLWKKAGADGAFVQVGTLDVSGSANSGLVNPGNDANGQPWGWTVGRGRYGTSDIPGENHGDRWLGGIDEVRFSNVALTPETFIAGTPPSTADTDADGMPDAWERANLGGDLSQGPEDDYDLDLASNLSEYLAGTNPNNDQSWPDTDADGMNDGWEKFYFGGSLAQGPLGDPDNDYSTNAEEFAAGTSPSSAFSFPDLDNDGFGDGMSDGWERHYFPGVPIENVLPEADPDGDLVSNLDEFSYHTDPTDQLSSRDTDGDYLPDGWEVRYFALPGESLTTVVAKQGAAGDPDGDTFSNLAELQAGTNPSSAASKPGSLAWWRFEEATTGPVAINANNVVLDSSGNGYHMRTYNDLTAPEYSTDVPFPTVPNGGQTNTASLYFDGATDGSWLDLIYTEGNALRTTRFGSWTVEASFKLDATDHDQGIVAKDGNPIGGQSPFHMKYYLADGDGGGGDDRWLRRGTVCARHGADRGGAMVLDGGDGG